MYYHIVRGSKVRLPSSLFQSSKPVQVFYFIRPTPANLAAYERWSGTEMQNHSWLGDMCDEVFKVELQAGNTMIIPTGWIHAVVSHGIPLTISLTANFTTVYARGHASVWGKLLALVQCRYS